MEKSNLHIHRPDWEEIEAQIRAHRTKRLRRVLVCVCICVFLAAAYILYATFKEYDAYTITEELSRTDTAATHYTPFEKGYIKYSNDGISYVTTDGTLVWNQSYGMENPMVCVCAPYVCVADEEGGSVYVMNAEDIQCEISVTKPILRAEISAQGTTALLMEEDTTGYLALYDAEGSLLAEGAIYMENAGTPVDIAISTDGKNLTVSIVDISGGTADTTLQFYNFSASGQNEIDNLCGTITYENTLIPQLYYTDDSTLLAFSTNGVYVCSAGLNPAQTATLLAEEEIQSIFYDEKYFGLVYLEVDEETDEVGRRICIYDTACTEKTVIETKGAFDSVFFLKNHELCLLTDDTLSLYTLRGTQKFSLTFSENVCALYHELGWRNYVVLTETSTERIRLQLFEDLVEEIGFGSLSEWIESFKEDLQ